MLGERVVGMGGWLRYSCSCNEHKECSKYTGVGIAPDQKCLCLWKPSLVLPQSRVEASRPRNKRTMV